MLYRVILLSTVFNLLIVGCGPPPTVLRRTATIVAPRLPDRVGSTLPAHHGRVSIGMDPASLSLCSDPSPAPNSPGLMIPTKQFKISAAGAVSDHVELDGGFFYAPYAWTEKSAAGVLPYPAGANSDAYELNLGVQISFLTYKSPVDVRLSIEGGFSSIPEATYVCTNCPNLNPQYRFDHFSSEYPISYLVGVHVVANNIEIEKNIHLSPFFVEAIEDSITNNGFDPNANNINNDTIKSRTIGVMGVGLEANIDNFVPVLTISYPAGFPQDYNIIFPDISLEAGIQF